MRFNQVYSQLGLLKYSGVFGMMIMIYSGCAAQKTRESTFSFQEPSFKSLQLRSKRSPSTISNQKNHPIPETLGPGNEIEMICLEDPKLNGKYRIDFEGKLKLPYETEIPASGLTLSSLQKKILDTYKTYFKNKPHFELHLSDPSYWVKLQGLVERPGEYLIQRRTSLDELIAMAGGLQKSIAGRYARILQNGKSNWIDLVDYYRNETQQIEIPLWQGGEVIFIQSDREGVDSQMAGFHPTNVQILGEVRNPGEQLYKPQTDFIYYLSKSGGPTEHANLKKIEIVEGPPGKRESKYFNLEKLSNAPFLQSGDTVIVHADKPTFLERSLPVVGGFFSIISSALLLAFAFHAI